MIDWNLVYCVILGLLFYNIIIGITSGIIEFIILQFEKKDIKINEN